MFKKKYSIFDQLDYAAVLSALLGYMWGFFSTDLMLASLVMSYGVFSPLLIPMVMCTRYTLPVFIALGIYPVIKHRRTMAWVSSSVSGWVASVYVFLRALTVSYEWYDQYDVRLKTFMHPFKLLHALCSLFLVDGYFYVYCSDFFTSKDGLRFSYNPGDWLWKMMLALPPFYLVYHTLALLCPPLIWSWIAWPTWGVLWVSMILVEAPVVSEDAKSVKKPTLFEARSSSEKLFYLLACIAVIGQAFVFSHAIAVSVLQLAFMPDIGLWGYGTLRVFAAHNLILYEGNLVVEGAECAHKKAESFCGLVGEYVPSVYASLQNACAQLEQSFSYQSK